MGRGLFLGLALLGCAPDDELLTVGPGDLEPEKADATLGNVEIKVVVAAGSISSAGRTLKLTSSRAQERDIYFYDEPGLPLNEAGVILRARKVYGGADDSTVKLRPWQADWLDESWLSLSSLKCEIDRTKAREMSSCSSTVKQDKHEIDDVAAGERAPIKLFSADQEAFAALGLEPAWNDLIALGPIESEVWKLTSSRVSRTISVERWTLPDGSRFLELSVRAGESQAASAEAELTAFVASKRLTLDPDAESKTLHAMQFFAP